VAGVAASLAVVPVLAADRDKSPPEREPSAACGNFDYRHIRMSAGPADYRVASESLILLVENAHFTPEVERLSRGKSSTIGGDLAYTLRVFPTYPRALKAAAAYERKRGPAAVKEMGFSTQCWFDRAVAYRSNDPNVRIVIATEFIKRGQKDAAREHVRVAEQFAKDNGAISYNVGLLYFELGDYEQSMSFARQAYDLGLNLPGLKQKLTKAGKWKD
jgi:tetratricopeptide (TPR) repeat protein